MNNDQKKMLTEFLGKKWNDYYRSITKNRDRTFLTWDDLGACKDKLVGKGLINDFYAFSFELFKLERNQRHYSEEVDGLGIFFTWLFRPVDESGEPHFCRLVAEFLEERK